VLVDPHDPGTDIRALVYLEHAIQDGRTARDGGRQVISPRLEFVELDGQGGARDAGFAPYLDYRPIRDGEHAAVAPDPNAAWLREDLGGWAVTYAVEHLVPKHLQEVREDRDELIRLTESRSR
jgi:hypothetical protein